MEATKRGAPEQRAQNDAFRGFEYPRENWSKLPHALIDELPRFTTKGELAVVLYVLRHTWGYRDPYKRITLDEFVSGRKRRDGSRIDGGVGMGREAIIKGIRRAVKHGFLQIHTDDRDGGRVAKYYALNVNDLPEMG